MKAIGYVRVSTDKQEQSGLSLEAQTQKIEALAALHGFDLVNIIQDTESGKWLKRPGVQDLISKLPIIDAVLIAKLDRLTRSLRDIDDLLTMLGENEVQLISAAESLDTKSAAGRLVINIMTAVAQWEREAIGERTREAMKVKKAAGKRVGSVPYGMREVPGGGLDIQPLEQEIIGKAKSLSVAGMGLTQIALALNAMGHRTRKATPWRKQYVQMLLEA